MRGRMPEWVERANRSPVQIAAALHLTGRELPVTIIEMSEEGCRYAAFTSSQLARLCSCKFQHFSLMSQPSDGRCRELRA